MPCATVTQIDAQTRIIVTFRARPDYNNLWHVKTIRGFCLFSVIKALLKNGLKTQQRYFQRHQRNSKEKPIKHSTFIPTPPPQTSNSSLYLHPLSFVCQVTCPFCFCLLIPKLHNNMPKAQICCRNHSPVASDFYSHFDNVMM